MTTISDIDEHGINVNLKVRYKQEKIYTYTGSILVAVNPYKMMNIYGKEYVAEHRGKKLSQTSPHIFAVAEAAIQNLCDFNKNQSCIISGESGAGKTESTKLILQYLCSVTNHICFWTEQQILEANTILEAFGNAKTVRNDNSSRFGKFLQVCLDEQYEIKGCIVQDYLLEQSRITFQSPNERNYHVFYQLVMAAQKTPELQEQFHLGPADSYFYLSQSGCYDRMGADEPVMFDNLRLAMNVLSIPEVMVNGIFSVLSAILLLGNLTFEEDVEGEKSQVTENDVVILTTVCELLGFELEAMTEAILHRQIQVRGTITSIPFKFQEARENRHAMAKALYSRCFAWLVDAINKCTNPGPKQNLCIGILDIFGFENFEWSLALSVYFLEEDDTNSFEQLCINYTNEKLHKFFNHYVFAMEQEMYKHEEIEFDNISFTDNSPCVELIEKSPRCLLKILDEECRFPKGTDKTYLNKQHHEFGSHDCYVKGQDRFVWEQEFGVKHYAGLVVYNVNGFLDKNKDTQQDQLFELMHNSTSEFVKDLTRFQDLLGVRLETMDGRQTISRTSRSKPTVGDTFRHQLSELVDVLAITNPWYVRCLKPNSRKQPNNFVEEEVLTQLRYSGMLDIIRIRREGYPIHLELEVFLGLFGILCGGSKFRHEEGELSVKVRTVLKELELPPGDWQVGMSKVFMRNNVFDQLDELRMQCLTVKAICIQKHWRGFYLRREYLVKRHAVMILQFNFRCFRSRLAFLRKRKAAIVLQSHLRGMFDRRLAKKMREEIELERKRQRELELAQEQLRKEQERAKGISLRKSIRESTAELESLTSLMESMWSHYQPPVSPHSLDLDTMFEFLQEERSEHKAQRKNKADALDEINEEFEVLESMLTEAQVSAEKMLEDHEVKTILTEMDSSIAAFDDTSGQDDMPLPAYPAVECPLSTLSDDDEPLPSPPPYAQPCKLKHDTDSADWEYDVSDVYQEITPVIPSEQILSSSPPILPPPPPFPAPSLPLPPPPPPLPPPRNGSMLSANLDAQKSRPISTSSVIDYESGRTDESDAMQSPVPDEVRSMQVSPPGDGNSMHFVPPPSLQMPTPPNGVSRQLSPPDTMELSPPSVIKLERLMNGQDENSEMVRGESVEDERSLSEDHAANEDSEMIHDLLEYAEKFFNAHVKDMNLGTISRSLRMSRRSSVKHVAKEEMLTFSKSGSIPTSLVHLHDNENINVACRLFRELTKVMQEELKDDTSMHIMRKIVKTGIDRAELRDEIFCQLIKQTNGNPEADSLLKGWVIMCLCAAAFSPSKNLQKYLLSYVKMNCSDALVGKYALMCHKQLTVPRVTARTYPPSAVEIMSVRALSPVICKVHFMDGKTKAVSVLPCDTSTELLQKLSKKIGLRTVDGWAIYEVTGEKDRCVRRHEYVCDILAQWEMLSSEPKKGEGSHKDHNKSPVKKVPETKLIFKKRIYRHVQDVPNDPVEYHLLYAEAVHKVVKLDHFAVSDKVALQLAGLQAQVICGDYQEDKSFRYSEAEQYLPGRILASSGKNWSVEVARAHQMFGSGKTELEAKVWYLTCVKQFPLYGCALFPIVHKGVWLYTSETLLGINMDGIKFVRAKDSSVIANFPYKDIQSLSMDQNNNYISLELKLTAQLDSPQRTYLFEVNNKEEVGLLIASYSPCHASWIHREADSLRKMKMSDEEKLKLYEEIVRCRRALSESGLLQPPVQDGGANFLKNTLRRLTKSKLERLRKYSYGCDQLNIDYWSHSKSPLRHSLTLMHDPLLEDISIKMFNSILVYAKIEDSSENHDNIGMVQNMMLRCLESDPICNELYLQLIKQTTDHPDPNSLVNWRCWKLLCVVVGVRPPPNTRVFKYLQVHLKKCSVDTASQESSCARFCYKILSRTVEAKRRKFPPSRKEIESATNRQLITECVYFLNGEQRIIEFDAAASCGEIIRQIKAKIGMQSNAEGFTVTEVISGSERSMAVDERLSDTMCKWERLALSGAVKDFRLCFKKRLFVKPYVNFEDPVECDLVFHQLMEDVFYQRVPLSTDDAVRLCALKVQSEIEDMQSEEINYCAVTKILPRNIRNQIRIDDISTTHKTVLDMSPRNAVISFITVLTSWQLFGSTLFEIGQTYTSLLPKVLLLAVHERGIHLLECNTFNVLRKYSYCDIVHVSPAIKSIMIVIGDVAKGTKFMFNTNQASQVAELMKDYMSLLVIPREGIKSG